MSTTENAKRIHIIDLFTNGVIVFVMWGGGWLGDRTAYLPEWQSLLWPPTGIALAFLLFGGYKYLPGVVFGAFVYQFTQDFDWGPALFTTFSTGLSAAAGTFLLRAFGFQSSMSRLSDVYRLLFFGSLVSTLINATLDTANILIIDSAVLSLYGVFWFHSWLSHFLGILLFTPFLLAWLNKPPNHFKVNRVAEGLLILLLFLTTTLAIRATGAGIIVYLPFPFLMWAAFRLQRRGTLLINLIIVLIAIIWMKAGLGGTFNQSLLNVPGALWFFMSALTITAVSVSVANHERQLTKTQLQEERDFAVQIMSQLGQGITITGPNRRFEYVNSTFATMLGYTPEELMKRSPFKLAISEDAHLLEESYTAKQNRETTTYETRLLHKNGRIIHAFVTSVPRIRNDEVIGTIAVLTDLTERNKVEQKLRRSEQKHKNLYTSAQRKTQELALLGRLSAALARELNESIIYATVVDTLADTFGYDLVSLYTYQEGQVQLQHQRGFTNVHRSLSINSGVIGRVIRTGESAYINDTSSDPDYISLRREDQNHSEICVPIYNETNIVGAINVERAHLNAFAESDLQLLTMLSEHVSIAIARARLYSKVINNEKRFRSLIEHNPATITLVDNLGNHISTESTAAPDIQDNLLNPNHIHPNDVKKVAETFQSLLKNPGLSQNIVHRTLDDAGNIHWVERTFTNLLHEPAVQAIVINSRDITQRKQAEEALQQAQKLESLGILAGGIAHDFNNLLVAMMGQISLAQIKGDKESPAQPHLQKAYTATERASTLTRQLLAYSGQGQFQIESINLNQLITDNLHLFSVGLPKTIVLTSNLCDQLPLVRVDIGQMQQVIMNLIINGAEAISSGVGAVNISTTVTEIDSQESRSWAAFGIAPPPGSYVTLSVADDGAGMDDETLSKIFDPFFTTKFTGRGLGLAAVQGIIRGHNGGLTVHSVPGEGSRFDLLFPVDGAKVEQQNNNMLKEDALAYVIDADSTRPGQNETTAVLNGKILVVDDEAPVRDTLVDILSSERLEVVTAVNAPNAIQLLKNQQDTINLIILDLSMPGITVDEAITQFRQIAPAIPIMVSSGYSETEVHQRLGSLNVAGFLQKPYNVDKLISTITTQLRSNKKNTVQL